MRAAFAGVLVGLAACGGSGSGRPQPTTKPTTTSSTEPTGPTDTGELTFEDGMVAYLNVVGTDELGGVNATAYTTFLRAVPEALAVAPADGCNRSWEPPAVDTADTSSSTGDTGNPYVFYQPDYVLAVDGVPFTAQLDWFPWRGGAVVSLTASGDGFPPVDEPRGVVLPELPDARAETLPDGSVRVTWTPRPADGVPGIRFAGPTVAALLVCSLVDDGEFVVPADDAARFSVTDALFFSRTREEVVTRTAYTLNSELHVIFELAR